MSENLKQEKQATTTLPGVVEKISKGLPSERNRATIRILSVDEPYNEIVIDNLLNNQNGESVPLEPGAEVQVTLGFSRHDITGEES